MTGAAGCLHFRFVESSKDFESILEKRLPVSANVFNMSKVYDKFAKPEEMAFYMMLMGKDGNEALTEPSCWILAKYYREDYMTRYAISSPRNVVITPEVKEAFTKCPYIDWNEPYMFACIPEKMNQMIWEISTMTYGNGTSSMPCKIFFMDTEQASKLDATNANKKLLLKSLDAEDGPKFISSTWKYALGERTAMAVRKLLERITSPAGLYETETGKIICGICINDCGLMGMLHTLPEHRGKGYARLVVNQTMKSFATEFGAVPCSAVEIRNTQSVAFHESLGMTCSHFADFIKYVPQTW